MAEIKHTEVLKNISKVVDSVSFVEAQKAYDEWSKTYDADYQNIGSKVPFKTALVALKYLNEESVILDIGSGTGRVTETLRKHHFNGLIDVLDANLEMLLVGEKKQLNYRNIIRHSLDEEGTLPLKDRMYDMVVSSGSFLPNHIPSTALKGIVKVVKKNGMLVVNVRGSTIEKYKARFDQTIKDLVDSGRIVLLETQECEHYSNPEKKLVSIIYAMKVL